MSEMLTETITQIEPATAAEDDILIGHYMAIWESYGTPPEHYADDARERVSDFIEQCRKHAHHGAFIATIDGEVAGSVVCCLLRSPYPDVIEPEHRMRGYIWSVFTTPGHRRKGVGKQLTARAVKHLRDVGCTQVVLHASAAGESVYEALGFVRAGEMRLDLKD
jgi:GNAT superfamily N-acetyltransferase